MAAANILTTGTSAADSADIVVTTTPLTVCLKDAAGPLVGAGALVYVLLKDDTGQYFTFAQLDRGHPAIVLTGAGTYRFSRVAGTSCGVFSG